MIVACVWGKYHVAYMQAWIPTVLSVAVWSYLLIYIIREWKNIEGAKRIRQPFFWCILLLLLCMILSVNQDTVPYWYLMMYGGFYLVGIRREARRDFFNGLLNGVILWFFAQQIIAFGFRPYDYLRYKGMYAWETFNSLFYLIIYCAVSLKWLFANKRKAYWLERFFWFFLSAGCVSFTIFTGGRSAILGVAVITVILYSWYDLKSNNSFYRLLLHAVTWILCVAITFPLVYDCIRYLPTVLHHPIWFEGEYVEGKSVCSYDSWDSEKYITYEEAIDANVGRMLSILGIDIRELTGSPRSPFTLIVYAADETINNAIEKNIYVNSVGARKLIYVDGLKQLNWYGHTSGIIQVSNGNIYVHAHNMFLDMAYRHGILAGVLYLGLCFYSILQVIWRRRSENIIYVVYFTALISFGMFEQLTLMGQFGVALIWILFYFVGEESKEITIGKI